MFHFLSVYSSDCQILSANVTCAVMYFLFQCVGSQVARRNPVGWLTVNMMSPDASGVLLRYMDNA
jgi:hypothetical protein